MTKIILENLDQLIKDKYISVNKHPTEDLFIYNYTEKCQYDRVWNETTLNCRGLILNSNGDIIARPFKKFFNIEEHEILPYGNFRVFEKMDGSLGIMYWLNDKPHIATRGSFSSDQALWATKYCQGLDLSSLYDTNVTHLFEIIYPQNRIVCDYGDKKSLVHLATISNKTGDDIDFDQRVFEKVKEYYGIEDYRALISQHRDNKEGYVLRWHNHFRVKVKHQEYVRLHRIVTNLHSRSIWECAILSDCRYSWPNAKDFGNKFKLDSNYVQNLFDTYKDKLVKPHLLSSVPEYYHKWIDRTYNNFFSQYQSLEIKCLKIIHDENLRHLSRKEAAQIIASKYFDYSSILFAMLDNKHYNNLIWLKIRPEKIEKFLME